jgi:hypothetical protein
VWIRDPERRSRTSESAPSHCTFNQPQGAGEKGLKKGTQGLNFIPSVPFYRVKFRGIAFRLLTVLQELEEQESLFIDLDETDSKTK